MLATFMGYFYTMKSELDATVVVIGIQKRRSLSGSDHSQNDISRPQFLSSAPIGKAPDARNSTQKPNGTAEQGLSKVAYTDQQAHNAQTSCNGRPFSSLPTALHSKPVQEKVPTVLPQNSIERSRSSGRSSPSRAFGDDSARAIGAITPPGQRRIGRSRHSSLASSLATATTKVSALRSLAGSQQAVAAGVSSRDPTSSVVVTEGKSPSEEASTLRKKASGKRSSNQERTATPSLGRSKSRGEASSRSSSRHATRSPSPRSRPVTEHH